MVSRKYRHRLHGQSLVEFSLVVLFMVLLMIGIIDFGRLFFTYGTVANAAREGARYGVIHPSIDDSSIRADPNNIEYRTRDKLAILGNADSPPLVEISYPENCATMGCPVSVKVSAYYKSWTPLIPAFTVIGQSIMYIE